MMGGMTPELRAACDREGRQVTSIVADSLIRASASLDPADHTQTGTRLMTYFGATLMSWAAGHEVTDGVDPVLLDIVTGHVDAAEDWATYLRRADPQGPLDEALAAEVDKALLVLLEGEDGD